jgi:hypothetical protein
MFFGNQCDVGVLIVGGTEPAQFIEHNGEQVKEVFQALGVLDHAECLEIQFIDPIGKFRCENALIVFHLEMNIRLFLDELPDVHIGELSQDHIRGRPLDDKFFVKIRVTDFDILHPEHLPDATENTFPIDAKPETVRIHIRSPQSGERG